MVFVPPLLVISLSIMLSSSIHAVAKRPLWKTVWNFLRKLKMELAFDPAILLLGLYPKYHNFLIHSFTNGHLGCFQHLAIVNCAAMNIGVHRYFWIGVSGFLGYIPAVELLGQKAVPF